MTLGQRTVRDLRKQPAITTLLLLSLSYIAAHTALLNVPEVMPAGAEIGNVVNDLAIASVGAWVFNLLVVVIPRNRTERAALKAVQVPLTRLASTAYSIERELAVASGLPYDEDHATISPPRPLTVDEISTALKGIQREDCSPKELAVVAGTGEIKVIRLAWWQWLDHYGRATDAALKELTPLFTSLPEDVTAAIFDACCSDWAQRLRYDASLRLNTVPTRGVVAEPQNVFDHVGALRTMSEIFNKAVKTGG